jgi:uncharacterized protein
MNSVSYFEIQADDPAAAVQFYGAVFGWTFEREPHAPIEYWRIETDSINGGLLKRPAPPTAVWDKRLRLFGASRRL